MSPLELQRKYTVALGRIGGETSSDGAHQHKPLYERNSQLSDRQAIAEAAYALTALWKVRKGDKA